MIQPSHCGCIARAKKQNEIIKALNPLLKIKLIEGSMLAVHYSDNNVVMEIPSGESGESEELDLIICVSGSPVTKTFLVKP